MFSLLLGVDSVICDIKVVRSLKKIRLTLWTMKWLIRAVPKFIILKTESGRNYER
jgi:hypothetical protein